MNLAHQTTLASAPLPSTHSLGGSGSLTEANCFDSEGADHQGKCRSLFFNGCDSFTMQAGDSCIAYTYSDSQVSWFSKTFSVVYWELTKDSEGECTELATKTPNSYHNEATMLKRNGVCGFKYQISNSGTYGEYNFEILKNGAAAATLGLASVALAASMF